MFAVMDSSWSCCLGVEEVDEEKNKQNDKYQNDFIFRMLRGAEEACWAHNPKVLGSKPSGATLFCKTQRVPI